MAGQILFSTFSPARRTAMWQTCRANKATAPFALIVPTTAQLGLMQRSFPNLAATFVQATTLADFAAATLVALAPETVIVTTEEVFALVGEVAAAEGALEMNRIVMQIEAWQRAGLLQSSALATSADQKAQQVFAAVEALLQKRLGVGVLPTTIWAEAELARRLTEGARPTTLPGLLLEGFVTMATVDKQLLAALTSVTTVVVRLYDIHDAPALDSIEQSLVESLIKSGKWSADPDPLPDDFKTVQSLAERLFGDASTELDATAAQKHFTVATQPTLAKQLTAMVAQVNATIEQGSVRGNIMLAVPDSPELRVVGAMLLAGINGVLRWSAPALLASPSAGNELLATSERKRPPSTLAAAHKSMPAGPELQQLETTIDALKASRALQATQLLPWTTRVAQLAGLLAAPGRAPLDGSFAEGKIDVVAHHDLLGRAGSVQLFVVDADGTTYPAWGEGEGNGRSAQEIAPIVVHACKMPTRVWLATTDGGAITNAFVERVGAARE